MNPDYIITIEERGNGFAGVEVGGFVHDSLSGRVFEIVRLERDGHIDAATRPGGADRMRVGAIASDRDLHEVEAADARVCGWQFVGGALNDESVRAGEPVVQTGRDYAMQRAAERRENY